MFHSVPSIRTSVMNATVPAISVYNPLGGTGGPPVLVYVVVNSQLTQVQKLINRTPALYETNWFLYGTNATADTNDFNRPGRDLGLAKTSPGVETPGYFRVVPAVVAGRG